MLFMENLSNIEILLSIIAFVVLVLGILVSIALIFAIRILNDFRKIADMIKHGGETVGSDIKKFYESVKKSEKFWGKLFGALFYGFLERNIFRKSKEDKKN